MGCALRHPQKHLANASCHQRNSRDHGWSERAHSQVSPARHTYAESAVRPVKYRAISCTPPARSGSLERSSGAVMGRGLYPRAIASGFCFIFLVSPFLMLPVSAQDECADHTQIITKSDVSGVSPLQEVGRKCESYYGGQPWPCHTGDAPGTCQQVPKGCDPTSRKPETRECLCECVVTPKVVPTPKPTPKPTPSPTPPPTNQPGGGEAAFLIFLAATLAWHWWRRRPA